jgi:tripartite ATP-independent transporter DctM subunit
MPAILLVMTVLGVMFLGIAGPTEAAAVGALGSMVLAWWRGSLSFAMVTTSSNETLKATTMILWIALSSLMFVSVYAGIGGDKLVQSLLVDLDIPPVAVLSIMMVIIFLLGTVMDPVGIIFLTTPIFVPIVVELGYSPLYYGALLIINLEMSYLTPPFGYNIFYLKSVAPPGVTIREIYAATPPFIALQALGLVLCAAFPFIITWLPDFVFG